jgi:hypothetical protein
VQLSSDLDGSGQPFREVLVIAHSGAVPVKVAGDSQQRLALGHLLRVVFGVSFVVQDIPIPIPVWASGVAVVITGFLSYEGFHFARKSPPKG